MRLLHSTLDVTDRGFASSRPFWIVLPQAGIAALGLHLAADRLDDALLAAFQPLSWPESSLPANAAVWLALVAELLVLGWAVTRLLAARLAEPVADVRAWCRRVHPTAVGAPLFWLATSLAGAWCVGMAAEDVLATALPAEVAHAASWIAAGLVVWRFGIPAIWTTVVRVPVPETRLHGWLWTPPAVAMATLAAWHGLPIWGWF